MSTRDAIDIYEKAELAVTVYLRKVLQQNSEQGHAGEFPAVKLNKDDAGHWEFEINGTSPQGWTTHNSDVVPPQAIEMGAQFSGIFPSRKVALRLASLLTNCVPVGESTTKGVSVIEGVRRLQFEGGWEIHKEKFEVQPSEDSKKSGDLTMHVMVWPMSIILEVPLKQT